MIPCTLCRVSGLPDAVSPNRDSCAGQTSERSMAITFNHFDSSMPPPSSCLRRPYNKYRTSPSTFQKISGFYRFIKSIPFHTPPFAGDPPAPPEGSHPSHAAGGTAPPFRETERADGTPPARIRQPQPERRRQSCSFRWMRLIRLPSRDRPRSMKYIR